MDHSLSCRLFTEGVDEVLPNLSSGELTSMHHAPFRERPRSSFPERNYLSHIGLEIISKFRLLDTGEQGFRRSMKGAQSEQLPRFL